LNGNKERAKYFNNTIEMQKKQQT